MPKELQLRVRERKPKTSEDAAILADDITLASDSILMLTAVSENV